MSESGDNTDVIAGGCFCRSVRYEIDEGDYKVANCHCSMCRRCHAAPFVTWLVVPKERFRIVEGQPKRLDSSSHAFRQFCDACGSPLFCVTSEYPEYVDIATGSLDAPDNFVPTFGIHTDKKLSWVKHD